MSTPLTPEQIDAMRVIMGPENVHLGSGLDKFDPGFDRANLGSGIALTPENTQQIQKFIEWCLHEHVSVVTLGGRTGLVGGGVSNPGQVSLLTKKFGKILKIDPIGRFAIVESGVTLAALSKAVEPFGLSAGIDLAARDSCTIGGMIATNAGGMEAFRNGSMRSRVLGLEAVMADGSLLDDMTTILKSNIGYDIKHLLIGSEGTLGIITKAVIRLEAIHARAGTFLLSFNTAAASLKALRRLRSAGGVNVLRSEIMWRTHFETAASLLNFRHLAVFAKNAKIFVILEVELDSIVDFEVAAKRVLEKCESTEGFVDALALKSQRERADVWRIREDWVVDRQYPGGLWYDVSVPQEQLDEYVNRLEHSLHQINKNLILFVLGHLCDANLHITITSERSFAEIHDQISDCVYQPIKGSGGSFSAEHGIGIEKKKALLRWGDPARLKFMRLIKAAFDPTNLLNPGKILP